MWLDPDPTKATGSGSDEGNWIRSPPSQYIPKNGHMAASRRHFFKFWQIQKRQGGLTIWRVGGTDSADLGIHILYILLYVKCTVFKKWGIDFRITTETSCRVLWRRPPHYFELRFLGFWTSNSKCFFWSSTCSSLWRDSWRERINSLRVKKIKSISKKVYFYL